MRIVANIPIRRFVHMTITKESSIHSIIDSWSIERENIIKVITEHFIDMGIFEVSPVTDTEQIRDSIIHALHYHPDFKAMLIKIHQSRTANTRK
ncbi:MAG: hypothetical protein AB8C84_06055 [Oligoflexales bacterium]